MQDKHIVIFRGKEDRDIFINKVEFSKTVYQIDGIGGKAESGDILVGNQQGTDWILAKYIVDHYDNLHEYTMFTQADPNDHVVKPELAIKCKLTGKFGCFGYARSLYEQYTLTWDRLHATTLSAKRLGIDYKNSLNCRKAIYLCEPGTFYYVHRDRIREKPKSFYENIIKCDNDEEFFDYVINYDHPQWLYHEINKIHPQLRTISNKDKIAELTIKKSKYKTVNASKTRDDYFGVSTEPLWNVIFGGKERFDYIENQQASVGNIINHDTRNSSYDPFKKYENNIYAKNMDMLYLTYRIYENDYFDFQCPHYLKWRKALVEKTLFECRKRGFDGMKYIINLRNSGCKHISL